ncbi:MAG: formate dehydrogenase accessory sulfurtransferase FdhD [Nitrospirota bacterium]
MEPFKRVHILKLKKNSPEEAEDFIAVEKRLRILVNGQNLLNLYCTPLMVRELAVGIIYNEGLIKGQWCADRISIEYGDEITADIPSSGEVYSAEATITSGCAGGVSLKSGGPEKKISDNTVFNPEMVKELYREFQKRSEIFRLTGGVHSAALAGDRGILAFAEDIGRHNAVDKVTGYCILENISFEGKMMMVSGRLSSEIVLKCSRCGIPLIVSRAAPTSLAVEIAESGGITLVGFMRGDRMNVYTGEQRIHLQ